MKTVATILICCASVSSGFSGKPSGEWLAEWLGLEARNEARICQKLSTVVDQLDVSNLAYYIDLDGSNWGSYAKNCKPEVDAIHRMYKRTEGAFRIIATVPDRNVGGWYRFWCAAETSIQGCLVPINKALREGCKEDCLLLDADVAYHGYEGDIHRSPDFWKDVAEKLIGKLK